MKTPMEKELTELLDEFLRKAHKLAYQRKVPKDRNGFFVRGIAAKARRIVWEWENEV